MDVKVVILLLFVIFTVLEANKNELNFKEKFQHKKKFWMEKPKGLMKHKKFKMFTRGECATECPKHEVCVKENGSEQSICLPRHVVRDSRKLFRRNHHKNHRWERKMKRLHKKFGKFGKFHGWHDKKHHLNKKFHDKKFDKMRFVHQKHDKHFSVKHAKHYDPSAKKKTDHELLKNMEAVQMLLTHGNQQKPSNAICDTKQKDDLRARIEGWFVVMHEQEREERKKKRSQNRSKRSLKFKHGKHHKNGKCGCMKSVMWQLHKLDEDKDGHLNQKELAIIENNHREHCIKPLLESCNTDQDPRLSKQELCCCFRSDPPCFAARQRVVDAKLPGALVPRCTPEGYYRRMQCNGKMGYCWCVDLNGNEIKGTRLHMKNGEPSCGKFDALGRIKQH